MKIEVKQTNDEELFNFLIEQVYKKFKKNINKYDELKKTYIKEINSNDKLYGAYLKNKIVGCAYLTYDNYIKDLFVKEGYEKYKVEDKLLEKIVMDNKKDIAASIAPDLVYKYSNYGFGIVDSYADSVIVERRVK